MFRVGFFCSCEAIVSRKPYHSVTFKVLVYSAVFFTKFDCTCINLFAVKIHSQTTSYTFESPLPSLWFPLPVWSSVMTGWLSALWQWRILQVSTSILPLWEISSIPDPELPELSTHSQVISRPVRTDYREKWKSKAMITIPNGRKRAMETVSVKLLKLRAREPAVLMDCAIVCLQINSYFLSSEIGSEESKWRAERMQSEVSEGFDSSFLPINYCYCLTQLVVMVKCASHIILQYRTEDVFESPYCVIL